MTNIPQEIQRYHPQKIKILNNAMTYATRVKFGAMYENSRYGVVLNNMLTKLFQYKKTQHQSISPTKPSTKKIKMY